MNYDLHDKELDSSLQKEKETMMNLDDFDVLILSTVNREVFLYSSVYGAHSRALRCETFNRDEGACNNESPSRTSVEGLVFTTT